MCLTILEATERSVVKRLVVIVALALAPGLAFGAGSRDSAKADRAKRQAEHLEKTLMELDPDERFIQVCSLTAADRISKDSSPYKPDRAVMDASAQAKVEGDKMSGDGAAFRSKGEWYQFSFSCETSPDHLKILSFDYRVGTKIPEEKWETYGLWK